LKKASNVINKSKADTNSVSEAQRIKDKKSCILQIQDKKVKHTLRSAYQISVRNSKRRDHLKIWVYKVG
jgi:hypothetical protein